jgi:hypothetical protein
MPSPSTPECVFCGQPITAGQPMTGRSPIAAHASCADAALADDRHWDAVADGAGDEPGTPADAPGAEGAGRATGTRSGCLALVLRVAVLSSLALLGLGVTLGPLAG